jgi:hypothetical protein
VPSDIIFYRTGREFVAWQRLDGGIAGTIPSNAPKDKDEGKETSPGSWVILEKSSVGDTQKPINRISTVSMCSVIIKKRKNTIRPTAARI